MKINIKSPCESVKPVPGRVYKHLLSGTFWLGTEDYLLAISGESAYRETYGTFDNWHNYFEVVGDLEVVE